MPRDTGVTNDDYKLNRLREQYAQHRRAMHASGHDPDFIGATEVAPICCRGCGEAIPWRTLRGWQD